MYMHVPVNDQNGFIAHILYMYMYMYICRCIVCTCMYCSISSLYIHVHYNYILVPDMTLLAGEQRVSPCLQEPASSGWSYHVGSISLPEDQGHCTALPDHEGTAGQ